jgi:RHS repeat-associated protein
LNSPRAVYDSNQQLRWRWDQQEPFGLNTPDENPSALGTFEFPFRFPGQYADKESGLFYNYFRDFNPALDIFYQSDPLGLRAGLNTYVYAFDPLTQTDPFGLMGRGPPGNSKGGPPARNPNKVGCGPSGGFWNPFVPNNPGFPFEPCCDAHDKCYDNCQGPDKLGCDMQGCACFSGTCKSYAGYVQSACQWAAQQYCYQITYSSSSDEQFKKARANCGGKCKPQ